MIKGSRKYRLTMKNGREFIIDWAKCNTDIWLMHSRGDSFYISDDIRIDASFIGIIEVLSETYD